MQHDPPKTSAPQVRLMNGYWTANVWIDGRRRHWSMGRATELSEARAQAILEERLQSRPGQSSSVSMSVQQLAASYLAHAERTYVRDDGKPTGEAQNILYALQPLIDLFGAIPAAEMRPRHFKVYVSQQISQKVSRQTINKRIHMLKRLLKWGAQEELLPAETWTACLVVEAIKAGRGARESKSIGAVPLPQVEQTLEFMPAVLAAMIRLQMATAMRPEEVCAMRLVDLDMRKAPWVYVPAWHKNKHRGHERRIYLGPKAREILSPYLGAGSTESPLFSPIAAVKQRRGKVPRRGVGECYDTRSYRKAIWYACDRAFPLPQELARIQIDATGRKHKRLEPMASWRKRLGILWVNVEAWRRVHRWSPNRLRKLGLDLVEHVHGKQAAKAYAGHSRVETTQDHYLSQDDTLARRVAEQAG